MIIDFQMRPIREFSYIKQMYKSLNMHIRGGKHVSKYMNDILKEDLKDYSQGSCTVVLADIQLENHINIMEFSSKEMKRKFVLP